jgi:hypothetical protein
MIGETDMNWDNVLGMELTVQNEQWALDEYVNTYLLTRV